MTNAGVTELVQEIACRSLGAKPLREPARELVLTYC